jgi:mono/diheme cytochrome c family protein
MNWLFQKRSRTVFLTIGLLLLFDLGRSINARVGFEEPPELWQPDPAVYADLTWPPGADLPPNTPVGERVFMQRCAVCHGPDGRGNGPAAPSLIPHPRNFTKGQFKYKSTPGDKPPLDADLIRTISNGLQASAMPYFKDLLSEDEIREVVKHIKKMSPVFKDPPSEALSIPPRVDPDAASIERGKNLFLANGCMVCHGTDGRGGLPLEENTGYPLISRDLTAPWTFRGGSDPKQIWLRVTTGLAPGPMPAYEETMKPNERWDVVNYVLSLARIPPWKPGGKLDGPGQQEDLLTRGRYILHSQMCGLCHTQVNKTGIYRGDDYYLAGGMRVGVYPHGVYISRNLTPDAETGLGNWTEEQIANALRNGRAPEGLLNSWAMIWPFFHSLEEKDALAIATYLKSRPPVRNQIPFPLYYGVVETIAVKLIGPLPEGMPKTLTYGAGNFGKPSLGRHLDLPQRMLIRGQKLVFAVGVVAFIFAGPRERRFPKSKKGWFLTLLALLGIGVLGLAGTFLYHTPTLRIIPPDTIAEGVTVQMPETDPAKIKSPEQAAMVERGRYLFKIVSCNMCHGQNASGGQKISWRPAGTHWTGNLTPHLKAGIGAWSDKEIERAIRSGISKDGRPLHWRGMVWDHASNLDEEDVRSVIAFLRTLPPVERAVTPFHHPDGSDCKYKTIWLVENNTPGCQ